MEQTIADTAVEEEIQRHMMRITNTSYVYTNYRCKQCGAVYVSNNFNTKRAERLAFFVQSNVCTGKWER